MKKMNKYKLLILSNALRRDSFHNNSYDPFYSSNSALDKLICPSSNLFKCWAAKKTNPPENKGKSGIYIWTNLDNGKSYVGSAVDLKNRLKRYLTLNYLETRIKLSQSLIYSAILRCGHYNFKLEILEYCDRSDVIDRENYYLNLLKPKYNILQIAGSSLGYKPSEETKNKIRASLKGKGENNPMFGLLGENHLGGTHSDETKLRLSKSRGAPVEVLDMQTEVRSNYFSMKKAAEALGCSGAALCKGLKKSNPFVLKKRFSKPPLVKKN